MKARFTRIGVGTAAGATLLAAACGQDDASSDESSTTVDVLAASSLAESFEALAETFEADHPGVDVRLVLDSSTTLATQVTEGAPADVLATADEKSMQLVVDAGAAGDARRFATNELVLVTPADSSGVESIRDLDDPSISFVACVETAPCGAVAQTLLASNGITGEPSSLEVDVKAVLSKVVADEADAGLVYASDARAAGDDVQAFPVPGSEDVLNSYAITVVEQTDDPALAAAWVDLVLSPAGRETLASAGFGPAAQP